MRELLSLAYTDGPPYIRRMINGVEHVFPGGDDKGGKLKQQLQQSFDEIIADWNSALHKLLVIAPPELVQTSRDLDVELDRLLDLAIDQRWSRESFRRERENSGRIAAKFVAQTREATGSASIQLRNVWTWAEDDLAVSVSTSDA